MATRRSGEGEAAHERDLVFALCHEIGNLLAAGRLEAALLARADAAAVARASERLSEISARAGSLLALVRPLLDAEIAPALATDPGALVAGLRRGLDAASDARVALGDCGGLPDVVVPTEAMHHLLLTEILIALETADRVRVTAAEAGGRVELAVEHAAEGGPEPVEGDALRGRTLARAVARALISRHGGAVTVKRGGGTEGVVFSFPAEDA